MKITVSKYVAIVTWLIVYFTSKMLWDGLLPMVFEVFSLGILLYGTVCYFQTRKMRGKLAHVILFYMVFCAYIILNAILQNTAQQFGRAIYEYCFYMLMFFSMSYYIEKCDMICCLKIVNCWGIIIAVLSWYEYLSKSYILSNDFIQTIENVHGFRATVFTRSYLSHAIILGFFAIVALYLFCETRKKRYIMACALCALSILTTSSRGPLVALTAAIFVFYIMNMLRKGAQPSRKLWVLFSVISIVLIGLIFLNTTFVTGNETIDYFLYRTRQIINWSGDAGNVGRLSIWKMSFDIIKNNFLFGIGPSHTGSWGSGSIGVTESEYLKYLCELGIVGFALILGFIASIIKYGKSQYARFEKRDKLFMIFLFSVITLVMVNNITVQSTEEIQVNFIWAVGMGGLLNSKINTKPKKYTINTKKQIGA